MSKLSVIALGTALMLVSVAAAADTYRWVDADGNVHYGDRPVRGSQEVEVRVPGEASKQPPTTPVAESGEDFDDAFDETEDGLATGDGFEGLDDGEPDAAGEGQGAEQVRVQLCQQARDRLQKYESADGLYEEGPDGQQRELSVDERVNTILKARQSVKDLCDAPSG